MIDCANKDTVYSSLLDGQIRYARKENRYLEFKSNYQDADRLGRYISALSNGACLDRQDFGYLYFGIDDGTLEIKGTSFDASKAKAKGSQALELYLRRMISPKINFSITDFCYHGNKNLKITVFKIPAPEWTRAIYNSRVDWTAECIEGADVDDLDKDAVRMAREGYRQRFPDYAEAIQEWSDDVFLDKAGLTQEGKITRAALLLVGKPEKAYKLRHIAQMNWKCIQDGETFSQLFTIPFIRTTTELMLKIRNYRFKIYPHDSLIPAEIWKYDTRSILEGLHNCIAHQDYTKDERIIVTEERDRLTFENAGNFFDGNYEQYVLGTRTPRRYRNPFLMKAMVNLKMIDSQGYGIHNLYVRQKERYLPMPDYDGTDDTHVTMHLPGAVIDENYSLILMENHDISLTEAVLLDQVQKGKTIEESAVSLLRKNGLIEGRKPNLFVAKRVAQKTNQKVEYSKHKGLDAESCESLLIKSLKDHGRLSRQEIDRLLWNVLSDQLNDKQKKAKIGNLLSKLRLKKIIANTTTGNQSSWTLLDK